MKREPQQPHDIELMPLRVYTQGKLLPTDEFLAVAMALAEAVVRLHGRGFVHRGIQAERIFISASPLKAVFSVVQTEEDETDNITPSTFPLIQGSGVSEDVAYMAPEQMGRNQLGTDQRTDIYSLGAVLYELSCQHLPHEENDLTAWVHAHIAKDIIPPSHWNERLPSQVVAVLLKCLQKNPADRYQSAYGLYQDLTRCQEEWAQMKTVSAFPLAQQDIVEVTKVFARSWDRGVQLDQLSEALGLARNGTSPVVVITGEAGAGKSTLVHDFAQRASTDGVMVASARCDTRPFTLQYGVLAAAFRRFLQGLLAQPEGQHEYWRRLFRKRMSPEFTFLIDVVPELEHFLSRLQTVGPHTRRTSSQVARGFARLIDILMEGHSGQPLLICLDNLHWIDEETMRVLSRLLQEHHTPRVFWLLVLDSQTLTVDSSWTRLRGSIEVSHKVIDIPLKGLEQATVRRILSEIYPVPDTVVDSLAREIHNRTHGNPFLMRAMITSLQKNGRVWFNLDTGQWNWTIASSDEEVLGTEPEPWNAEELLSGIPANTLLLLQWSTVIGHQFESNLLHVVSGVSREDIEDFLELMVRRHVIREVPMVEFAWASADSSRSYVFSHERIHTICLQGLSSIQRKHMEYTVGMTMLRNAACLSSFPSAILDICQHLNEGEECIKDKTFLTEINLWAGQQASSSRHYTRAGAYFQKGLCWLGTIPATTHQADYHHNLYFELQFGFANARCMSGEWEECERLILDVLKLAKNATQFKFALLQLVRYYFALGKSEAATAIVSRFLAAQDAYSQSPLVLLALAQQLQLYGLNRESGNWPFMQRNFWQKESLASHWSPSVLWLRTSELALQKSHSAALQHAQETLTAYERHADSFGLAATHFTIANLLALSLSHQGQALEHLRVAREHALAAHDPFLFMEAHIVEVGLCFRGEYSLAQTMEKLTEGMAPIRAFQNHYLESMYEALHGSLRLLMTERSEADSSNFELGLAAHAALLPAVWRDFMNLFTSLVMRKSDEALEISTHFFANEGVTENGFAAYADALFLRGWALAEQHASSVASDRPNILKEIERLLAQIKEVSRTNGAYQHLIFLLQAERARIQDCYHDAMDFYEDAAAHAVKAGLKQYSAIANERAGQYALARSRMNYARALLTAAIDDYNAWGAAHHARTLEEEHALVLRRGRGERRRQSGRFPLASQNGLTSEVSQRIDWVMVSRAAQALSREVVLEKLLHRLMHLVLESAGAQRGFILLVESGQLRVEAFASVDEPTPVVMQSVSVADVSEQLSSFIVDYTYRTESNTLLNEAFAERQFAQDPYIMRYKPKSVLCIPMLSRQKVVGVLYLENNRMTHAFTESRLELMKVLAAQAAISFENAFLYHSLEEKVRERTQALEHSSLALTEANERLEQANAELVESESMRRQLLANVSHDLRTPITLIAGYAEALATGVANTDDEVREFARRIQDKSRVLNHLIEDLFNLVRLEARQTQINREYCTAEEVLVSEALQFDADVRQAGLDFVWSGVDQTDITDEGTWIYIDRNRLHQVFANIIYNAIKHTPGGGEISLSLDRTSREDVVYHISDTGAGISQGDLPHVFDRFYKADKSRNSRSGSGLGLAIAKQIVDLHGGSIQVRSVLGEGTTFSVTLPQTSLSGTTQNETDT